MGREDKVLKIERRKIAELKNDPANARKHSPRNLKAIRDSLDVFGQQKPIVVDSRGVVIAGNGTLEAARELGWGEIDVAVTDLDPAHAQAFGIADNRTAELAEWDTDVLGQLLEGMDSDLADILSIDDLELPDSIDGGEQGEGLTDPDEVPEPPEEAITQTGDLWLLGEHRLLCGDSTSAEDVGRLFGGGTATMVHADPPYGMGKEKDGIANDNLYREKLDAFQMDWWRTWRPHLFGNGSAYIWGNAEDLWRLWHCGGLSESERMTFRSEITWDKGGGGFGVGTEKLRLYFPSERCLFFMLGEQGFNTNADNYWQGWESIRTYLVGERDKVGWNNKTVAALFGFHARMADHWFTKSQWSMPTIEQYKRLKAESKGKAFKREYDDLKREWYETRAYFDNTHDNMTDVWPFSRVVGDDRHGHATPKPVEMVARAINSSSREGDAIAAPFGGTGPEIIAAEQLGRKCYGMEIDPKYCDVIVKRWEDFTGQTATRENERT